MQDRYIRQRILQEFGNQGQQRLQDADITIVGCGGLGAIAAAYMAGAGVGKIRLVDGDTPDITNVHRQVFYSGKETEHKAEVLKNKLLTLNPEIEVESIPEYLTKENIDEIVAGTHLVIEGSDDIACKYLVNDFCAIENIPLVYGAIHKYEGYVSVFSNKNETDIHLRDIFPERDDSIPSCAEVGVLNTVAGIIGLLQANEAIKYIVGLGENLSGKLLTYDCLSNSQHIIKLKKTWTNDLEHLFDKNAYVSNLCESVPEIEIQNVMKERGHYTIVSVMSHEENKLIDAECFSATGDKLLNNLVAYTNEKELVVYCKSGRVSRQVVQKLLSKKPNMKVYSLKDGYRAYQKFKALH